MLYMHSVRVTTLKWLNQPPNCGIGTLMNISVLTRSVSARAILTTNLRKKCSSKKQYKDRKEKGGFIAQKN